MNLVKRSLFDIITARMEHDLVIVLTGARQTGKTTLCEIQIPELLQISFTYISFDDPDERLRFQQGTLAILESITTPLASGA